MTLFGFIAAFVSVSISLPDGAASFHPTYCVPSTPSASPASARDFTNYSRAIQDDNCSVIVREARVVIGSEIATAP